MLEPVAACSFTASAPTRHREKKKKKEKCLLPIVENIPDLDHGLPCLGYRLPRIRINLYVVSPAASYGLV